MFSKNNLFLQDGWVYFKIYCEEGQTEIVLLSFLKPLVNFLSKKRIIIKYFFLRYRDEKGFHIRFRAQCHHLFKYHNVIDAFLSFLERKGARMNFIKHIQIDTYEREVIRYGKITIDEIELFFFEDSKIVMNLLKKEQNLNERWIRAMALTAYYMTLLEPNPHDRLKLIEKCSESYRPIFNPEKDEFGKINEFYAKNKKLIYEYCDEPASRLMFSASNTKRLTRIISNIKDLLTQKDEPPKLNVFKDLIHMSLNRFLPNESNKNEFIIYEMLKIFIKSLNYRYPEKLDTIKPLENK